MASHDNRSRAVGGEALLAVWETVTGIILAPQQRDAFLARSEVGVLASKSLTTLVVGADAAKSPGRLRLDEWLQAIDALSEEPPDVDGVASPTGGYLSGPRRPDDRPRHYAGDYRGLRSRDGRFPQRPLDSELHKLMPRPQSYDDTF